MGQLALGALRGVKRHRKDGGLTLQLHRLHKCFSLQERNDSNLLDGVMVKNVASSADLVVVLEGGRSGLSLLQLLRHQLLCFQR